MRPGTALSQLADRPDLTQRPRAASPELKLATTIDQLLEDGVIRPADVVKLDVDGQELEVLRGMHGLLCGSERPRAVQVEVNPDERAALCQLNGLLRLCVWRASTLARAKRLIESGTDPDEVAFNGIL